MNSSPSCPASSAPQKPLSRIVAAVTARERVMFLDRALQRTGLSASIHFAAEEELRPEGWPLRLAAWNPEILITAWRTPPLPEDWLLQPDCPLQYVCHIAGSTRQLVPRLFIERGGIVTNWGDRISGQVAEHGLLLALAVLRNLPGWSPFIARPAERRNIADLGTRTLFGLDVGIHGFGGVARALVELLRVFGVRIRAHSEGVPDALMTAMGVQPAASLRDLFAESQVLFECESLRPATRGCVDASVLGALPEGAVFVNIGRGGLVDEGALLREGLSGRIRLALDVVSEEPLTLASPLLAVPGIVLSPHIGGPTLDRYADCGAAALANILRVLSGRMPLNLVTLPVYDRST